MTETFRLRWVNRPDGELVFHVQDGATVGRAPENEIAVDEDGVSRRHCRLSVKNGMLELEDLGSTNGTYINGERVRGAVLGPGDEFLVGRCLFRVNGGASDEGNRQTPVVGAETIQIALNARQSEYPVDLGASGRAVDHLKTLCRVIDAINAGGSPEDLFRQSLDALLETLQMDDGAVLVGDDPNAEPAVRVTTGGASRRPSRTVIEHVYQTGEAVLANDPREDDRLKGAASLVGVEGAKILCAPIAVQGRTSGALYLSAGPSSRRVGESELRLVTLVARQLALAAENLRRQELVIAENRSLRAAARGGLEIVGKSAALESVMDVARRASSTDVTILITGETGTGKELFARAIHDWSRRRDGPFIAVNCGAIPTTMVESELFGHEKGAFTGANERRIGRFEMARDGTLFLDEIGDLPIEVQVKLLRILEEKRFYRVGGGKEIRSDARIVAATNRDLDQAVADGTFRADLLFRIRVIELRVPSLAERDEDIPFLARHLLKRLARESGLAAPTLTDAAIARLREYRWPGNVRELRNVLERALILSRSDRIDADDVLPDRVVRGPTTTSAKSAAALSLKEIEKEHIREILESTGWNKSKAAEILGIGRTNIYEKIKLYGLEPPNG